MTPERRKLSPPAPIEVGLSTKLGLGAGAAALLPVIIDFLSNDAIDDRTRRLLIQVGAGLLALVIVGRYAQAVAVELTRGRRADT